MKFFLTYTSILEAITGIILVLFPVPLVAILFNYPLEQNAMIIVTMIAGSAIFSLAVTCYFLRDSEAGPIAVKGLFAYNSVLTIILLYGKFIFGVENWLYYSILIFHLFQAILCIRLLLKKESIAKLEKITGK